MNKTVSKMAMNKMAMSKMAMSKTAMSKRSTPSCLRSRDGASAQEGQGASRRASSGGAAEPKCMQLISGQLGMELKCKPEDVDDAP